MASSGSSSDESKPASRTKLLTVPPAARLTSAATVLGRAAADLGFGAGLRSFPAPPRPGSARPASDPAPPAEATRSRSLTPSAASPGRSSCRRTQRASKNRSSLSLRLSSPSRRSTCPGLCRFRAIFQSIQKSQQTCKGDGSLQAGRQAMPAREAVAARL